MKLRIEYHTEYRYSASVSFSPHLFRLFPRTEHGLRVGSQTFQTNATGVVSYRRDLFDNPIASVFYPEHSDVLLVELAIELSVEPRNAFGFLLASHALEFPFSYTAEEASALTPYLTVEKGEAPLPMGFWEPPAQPAGTTTALSELNHALHRNIQYERREEGTARSARETLKLGHGSCRDYAVLLSAILRQYGVAARLASGFLVEPEDGERYAYNALHAWVEAYLPGGGWIGFDPTNGYLCNHHHIATAVGTSAADITPILGRFYTSRGQQVEQAMSATLKVTTPDEENGQ